jgi:phosphatidylglycerophosphatase A
MAKQGLRLITVFGLGYLRPAPGTWGSLPPIIIAGAMLSLDLDPEMDSPEMEAWAWGRWEIYHAVLLAILLVFGVACLVQGDRAEARFNRKDPSEAVADEIAGQCLPLMFLPPEAFGTIPLTAFTLLLAFVSFRMFDIFKPWPARQVQRVPGGWGILLDDLVAGVYAALLLQILARVGLAGGIR